MKDLEKTSFVLGIQILRDRFRDILRYLSDLIMQHWKVVKRMMRYLRRTKGYMLTYQKFEGLEIIIYSDSDFVRCQYSKRSTFGYIYMLAGGAIFWKSVKQTLIAYSTIIIEFVTCFEASNQSSK
ncbi:hypothetical protein CR513_04013, partial [Mucuna pruriens]